MILGQQTPDADSSATEQSRQGAQLLHLAVELDRRIYQGIDGRAAIDSLRTLGHFNSRMLNALDGYTPTRAEFEVRRLLIRELRSGMVLDEDVLAIKSNVLVFKEGTMLTPMWVERLGNFARTYGVQERLRVRIPKLTGLGKLANFG